MSDLVGSLIVWLRTRPTLAGVTVAGRPPRDMPDKLVVVSRIGGPFDHPVMDVPTVRVQAWAATEALAHDLCQSARSLIWSLRGTRLNNVTVYNVEEFAGPAWLPDPDTDRPRFEATFSIRHREHLTVA
jgi:hypothetical protein